MSIDPVRPISRVSNLTSLRKQRGLEEKESDRELIKESSWNLHCNCQVLFLTFINRKQKRHFIEQVLRMYTERKKWTSIVKIFLKILDSEFE